MVHGACPRNISSDARHAVTIAVELGDLRRFDNPLQIMNYLRLKGTEPIKASTCGARLSALTASTSSNNLAFVGFVQEGLRHSPTRQAQAPSKLLLLRWFPQLCTGSDVRR